MSTVEFFYTKLDESFAEEVEMSSTASSSASFAVPRIVSTPGVCGGCPRIERTRIPVWMLLESWNAGCTDEQLLKNYPSLIQEDLDAARQFAELNERELQQQIQDNQDA